MLAQSLHLIDRASTEQPQTQTDSLIINVNLDINFIHPWMCYISSSTIIRVSYLQYSVKQTYIGELGYGSGLDREIVLPQFFLDLCHTLGYELVLRVEVHT